MFIACNTQLLKKYFFEFLYQEQCAKKRSFGKEQKGHKICPLFISGCSGVINVWPHCLLYFTCNCCGNVYTD